MDYKEQTFSLDALEERDETYRISTPMADDQLLRSIRSAGLINPPVVMEKGGGLTIISGFRRIAVCRRLEWPECRARLLSPDTGPLTCAKIAIADNSAQRELNLVEQARGLALLSSVVPQNRLPQTAAELGLPQQPDLIAKIGRINRLDPTLQELIASGLISLPVASVLADLGQTDALALANIFNRLKLSLNKQRDVITLCREIAGRENSPLADVLKDEVITKLLADPDLDLPRKASRIRDYLRKRRFPQLSRAETLFQERLKALKLGKGTRLSAPPHFEGTTYNLALSFDTLADLKRHSQTLNTLLASPDLKRILERRFEHGTSDFA